jgi:hypothetical protein
MVNNRDMLLTVDAVAELLGMEHATVNFRVRRGYWRAVASNNRGYLIDTTTLVPKGRGEIPSLGKPKYTPPTLPRYSKAKATPKPADIV